MLNFEIDKFSGPLDILLQLIEQEKLDISQISLAKVTDQYLEYLDKQQDLLAEELADFLVIATKLLMIKSKILLPQLTDEEDDSAEQLEAQLKMYKEYLEASKKVEKIINKKNFLFTRERFPVNFHSTFSPPSDLKADDLKKIFEELIKRIDYITNLPQKIIEKVISLQEMVSNLRQILNQTSKISFKEIIKTTKSKHEVVICFVALLELIKSGEAVVSQSNVFDEIHLKKI